MFSEHHTLTPEIFGDLFSETMCRLCSTSEVTKAIPSPEQETFAEVVSEAAVDFEHV